MSGEPPPDPPEHVILSAMQWREEQRKRAKPLAEQPKPKANGHAEPLPEITAAVLSEKEVLMRQFLDESSLLPARNVILFSGDGGTGKSLLAMQLGLACTTASTWLGIGVSQGPVMFMSAEDDIDEMTRRLHEICEGDGIDMGEAHTFHLLPMAGQDMVLAYEKQGKLELTHLFHRLEATLEQISPELLILDNLADVYSGNENNRTLAKHFIGILRGLAIKYDCIILLLGHPSLSGLASGTGMSGSTAWSNSVRSRLYLHRPEGASIDGDDDDARILEVMKANYGPIGQRFELKWCDGRFVRTEHKNPWDRIAVPDIELVKEKFAAGRWRVNEQAVEWGGYAVAEVLDWDVGRGIGAKERSKEQNRNRSNIRTFLAGWVRAKSIYVINGFTSNREPTQFYSDKEMPV